MKGLLLSLVLICITSSLSSQTIIPGGYVSGTWTANQSPYHVQGNINVHYDSILTLEPGVDVLFDSSYLFTIYGRLDASGTFNDSIRFTASNDSIGWKGIYFDQINATLDSSFLKFCSVTKVKKTNEDGGALYIVQSDKICIDHCRISNNSCYRAAGGIQIDHGNIILKNSSIQGNTSNIGSGGILCDFSSPVFSDLTISNNSNVTLTNNSSVMVGGLYFCGNPDSTLIHFKRLNIFNNIGGGIGGLALQFAPNVLLDQCNICYNEGNNCGGIGFYDNSYFSDSVPDGKNSIYFNKGGKANELYIYEYQYQPVDIFVDTFSVAIPDNYHVFPNNSFNFIGGIQYGFINPVDTNLFISVTGSDENDGLSVETPIRSFDYALRLIKEDPANPNTLWVLPGIFHLTESESGSTIYLKDNTNIKAIQNNQVTIDGDSTSRVFTGVDVHYLQISGFSIINGYTAFDGGGTFLSHSIGKIDSCNFDSNFAGGNGGGLYSEGSSIFLNSCTFYNNTGDYGGGIYVGGGGFYGFTINDCDFVENFSKYWGGGLYATGSNLKIFNSRFISNQCTYFGGGASIYSSHDPLLINCGFYNNEAPDGAGGLLLDYNSTDGNLTNCTFSDNISPEGSAMILAECGKIHITNSIFWNLNISTDDLIHVYDFQEEDSTIIKIDHTDLQGGENSIVLEQGKLAVQWLENNLNIKPEFTNPENSDYSLNWNSPCIEAGKEDTTGLFLPLTDLNGDPRIVNARVDIGAFEFQFPVSIPKPQLPFSDIRIRYDFQNANISIEFPENLTDKALYARLIKIDGTEVITETKYAGIPSITIAVHDISPGIYLVTISDQGKIINSDKVPIIR